jgi:hypothetical protein
MESLYARLFRKLLLAIRPIVTLKTSIETKLFIFWTSSVLQGFDDQSLGNPQSHYKSFFLNSPA